MHLQLREAAGVQIEDDLLEAMPLLDKKKLSSTLKEVFMRHVKSCEQQLELWDKDPEGRLYGNRARELLGRVRDDHKVSMQVYTAIQNDTVSDEDFATNYKPKMEEMDAKLQQLEEAMACATLNNRETLRDKEKASMSR